MNKEIKILDYLSHELSESERKEFELELEKDHSLQEELERYRELFSVMESEPLEQPSMRLAANFNKMLSEVENQDMKKEAVVRPINRRNPFAFLGIAASILILVTAGVMIGVQYTQGDVLKNQNSELVQLRSQMSLMLSDQSVSTRVNAVYVANEAKTHDPAIENMLLETLSKDESSHVRLAAVEALATLEPTEKIKDALMGHVEIEEDPFVKVALIQTITQMKDTKAVHTLDRIIDNDENPQFIIDEAHKAKLKLNQI